MSCDATSRRPRKVEWQNKLYQRNTELLGVADLPEAERIDALMTMQTQEMLHNLPFAQYFVGTTGTRFLPEPISNAKLSDPRSNYGKPIWCKEVVLGNTLHDVYFPPRDSKRLY